VKTGSTTSPELLVAYLNSTLAAALFEHLGSVMGGGALKVEATHLSSFPVPAFSPEQAAMLTSLGKQLAGVIGGSASAICAAIDEVVYAAVFGSTQAHVGSRTIAAALESKLDARHHRK
jgi:hypothetical protein